MAASALTNLDLSPLEKCYKTSATPLASVDLMSALPLASMDKPDLSSLAKLDKLTSNFLAHSTMTKAQGVPFLISFPFGSTSTNDPPPLGKTNYKISPDKSSPNKISPNKSSPNKNIPIKAIFNKFSPRAVTSPNLCKSSFPFPMDSYWTHTTPISDINYSVLPFATIARTLDLTKISVTSPGYQRHMEVHEVKLLDLMGVLGWFALQYILSAELLANNKSLLLMHLGNFFIEIYELTLTSVRIASSAYITCFKND